MIGIVIPTLGRRPDLLRLAVDSIAKQSAQCELVVVAPPEAVPGDSFDSWPGLNVSVHETELAGLSNAINEGVKALSGCELFGWIGDDDVLAPESLSITSGMLQRNPDWSAVYGRCRYIDAAGKTLFVTHPGRLGGAYSRWGKNLIPQPGSLFRMDKLPSPVLDTSLRYAMDYDLFLRLSAEGTVGYTATEVAAFRLHVDGLTSNQYSFGNSVDEAALVRARYYNGRRDRALIAVVARRPLIDRLAYRLTRRRAAEVDWVR